MWRPAPRRASRPVRCCVLAAWQRPELPFWSANHCAGADVTHFRGFLILAHVGTGHQAAVPDGLPKAFVCHASEDKERFVLPFAEALRGRGIDAWLDRWEMLAGDSLVDKIFEEGLKAATSFIIVLSKNSVNKPWVREEMNAAFVKRVEGKLKIIPVVIDDCEVPEALKSTLWVRVENVADFRKELDEVVAAVHGVRAKPPVGQPPKFADGSILAIPGLEPMDAAVLGAICELAIETGYGQGIGTTAIVERVASKADLSAEQVQESLEVLDERGIVEGTSSMGEGILYVDVTVNGFGMYAENHIPEYGKVFERVCFAIVNEGKRNLDDLVQLAGAPRMVVEHVLDVLSSRGLVKVGKYLGGMVEVYQFSPSLKRALGKQ